MKKLKYINYDAVEYLNGVLRSNQFIFQYENKIPIGSMDSMTWQYFTFQLHKIYKNVIFVANGQLFCSVWENNFTNFLQQEQRTKNEIKLKKINKKTEVLDSSFNFFSYHVLLKNTQIFNLFNENTVLVWYGNTKINFLNPGFNEVFKKLKHTNHVVIVNYRENKFNKYGIINTGETSVTNDMKLDCFKEVDFTNEKTVLNYKNKKFFLDNCNKS